MRAYLSGGMENAPELGRAWREELTTWLSDALGHSVFNPVEVQHKVLTDDEFDNFRDWRFDERDRFKTTVRKFIEGDLHAIETEIDYIICFWDSSVLKGGGTHGEVTTAYRLGIPVYLVIDIPFEDVSSWILGCSTREFDNFHSLKLFLLEKYGG
ncbi:MAG: hypothetical protein VX822_04880 [Candidatus Neomarinimicrobiota bacterium]|nr:hypothetical protein [Candidatus Neomarinimicrobiota bacterium]